MKALVYTATRELSYREAPPPVAAAGEAVVAVDAVGICGSDMHAYLGHDPRRVPPLILGHEAVGTVVAGKSAGQRMLLNPLITCGECDACLSGRTNLCAARDLIGMARPGAFAEQIAIPERNLIPLPADMPSAHAALAEPAATASHAIALVEKVLTRPISESRALVFGGGSVGLLAALLLADKGAREIHLAETNARRRETLRAALAYRVFDPVKEPPPAENFDVVLDAVGNEHTRAAAVRCAKSGAVIAHIGLGDNRGGLDARAVTLREITFIGCYTYTSVDLRAVLHKLHSGALGKLDWSATRPLAEGAAAFAELLAGECAAPKVILTV